MITDWNEIIEQERLQELEHKINRLKAELAKAEDELEQLKKKETN